MAPNQVDLNALLTLFVDRIDEVPATAAAVYHSDASAGVVNAVNTRRLITPVSGLGVDTAGTIDPPRWRWQAGVLYNYSPFTAGWTTHYIGPSAYDLPIRSRTRLS